jgi:hypothetical protein
MMKSMMDPKTNMPTKEQLAWHWSRLLFVKIGLTTGFATLAGMGGFTEDGSDNVRHIYRVRGQTVTLLEGPANGEYHRFTKKCVELLGYRMEVAGVPCLN